MCIDFLVFQPCRSTKRRKWQVDMLYIIKNLETISLSPRHCVTSAIATPLIMNQALLLVMSLTFSTQKPANTEEKILSLMAFEKSI